MSQDLCVYCSKVNNIVLCGPEAGYPDTKPANLSPEEPWIGPTIEYIQKTAATCRLCRVISTHLASNSSNFLDDDPTRRVGLWMINEHGYQSDGSSHLSLASASEEGVSFELRLILESMVSPVRTTAGVAGIRVCVEATPGSGVWSQNDELLRGLRVYAPKQCSAELHSIVMRKEVDEDLTVSALRISRQWLDECTHQHWWCHGSISGVRIDDTGGHSVSLPSRLIALTGDKWSVCRTAERCGRYAALSYCWGEAKADFRLLTQNVTEFEQEHEIDESVPRTYREAMSLTQALGLQYLWVDALCIVQDNAEEWEKEARAMATTYQYATVTIVALSSEGIYDGMLKRAIHSTTAAIPWLKRDDDGTLHETDHVVVTADLPIEFPAQTQALSGLSQEIKASRWGTRGWTFQEAALSRRILYMGRYNVYWECQKMGHSEDGWDDNILKENRMWNFNMSLSFANNYLESIFEHIRRMCAPSGKESQAIKFNIRHTMQEMIYNTASSSVAMKVAKRLQSWLSKRVLTPEVSGVGHIPRFLADYTARSLSVSTDRLIAFEGFAKILAQRTNQDFRSGVWTSRLAYGLYWRSSSDEHVQASTAAPSWSWASREGQVRLPESTNGDKKLISLSGQTGDLTQVTFVDENIRMKGARGARPESLKIRGYLASAIRTQDTCVAYPRTTKYLVDMLRLTLRGGHLASWRDVDAHLLFVEQTNKTKKGRMKPIEHFCTICKQALDITNEFSAVNHLETCSGRVVDVANSDVTTRPKLCGIAMFDDPKNAPSAVKVLLLTHAADSGTTWCGQSGDCQEPNEWPKISQDRVLCPSSKSVLGVHWKQSGNPKKSAWSTVRLVMKSMRVYQLLLLQETEVTGQYIRVGIGIGYHVPGLDLFGGIDLMNKVFTSSLTLV